MSRREGSTPFLRRASKIRPERPAHFARAARHVRSAVLLATLPSAKPRAQWCNSLGSTAWSRGSLHCQSSTDAADTEQRPICRQHTLRFTLHLRPSRTSLADQLLSCDSPASSPMAPQVTTVLFRILVERPGYGNPVGPRRVVRHGVGSVSVWSRHEADAEPPTASATVVPAGGVGDRDVALHSGATPAACGRVGLGGLQPWARRGPCGALAVHTGPSASSSPHPSPPSGGEAAQSGRPRL